MEPKDPSKRHFQISMVKSGLRFVAAAGLMFGSLFIAGLFFLLAEVLGVAEEL